ncbi:astacin-like metalloendopeptidase [Leptodactylus fuscus]|uniref:astacin-like metalloendopeptidase n=1 Tax=Leptodactylus fuscus TaxID=238119 RepID=UPI003F4E6D7A
MAALPVATNETRIFSSDPAILHQRKRRSSEDATSTEPLIQGNPTEESSGDHAGPNPSWFDIIRNIRSEPFLDGKYVIRDLDIAYRIGKSSDPYPNKVRLWPMSPDGFVYVPYFISSDFGSFDNIVITSCLKDIEDVTCMRFTTRTNETDYINFVSSTGCWSQVGRSFGAQSISLDKSGCIWGGVVTHEVLHALGLHHEHVRLDRDKYVEIKWDNIQPDTKSNFEIVTTHNIDLTTYDYNSIMHYTNKAFSIDGSLPTIVAVNDSSKELGQQFVMSKLDIVKINRLYNCKINSSLKVSKASSRTTTTTTPRTSTTTTPRTTTITTPSTITTTPRTTTTTPRTTTTTTPKTTTTPRTTTTTPRTTTTTTTRTTTNLVNILTGCGGNLTTPEGVFTSPNFPRSYPDNAYCHWNITTDRKFRVTFTDFDIEGSSNMNCHFDKLKIYDGRDFNAMYQLKDLCGPKLPSPITSYGNAMQFVFTSDFNVAWKGFRVVYQPV